MQAAELASRIAAILDELQTAPLVLGGTGTTVAACLSWLEREALSDQQMLDFLAALALTNHRGRFLNLVSHRDLRAFLRDRHVPWDYVLTHWEPSVNDTGTFFAGFLVGAGENIFDVLKMVVVVAGSPLSEELAAERDRFWEAIKGLVAPEFWGMLRQFASSPTDLAQMGVEHLLNSVEERLWNLEFFEAGRILGGVLAAVLTVVGVLSRLPSLARQLARIVHTLGRISLQRIEDFGITLARLREFITSAEPALVTPEGFIMSSLAGDDVVVLDRAGRALGRISKSEALSPIAGSHGSPARASRALGVLAELSPGATQWLAAHDLLDIAHEAIRAASAPHLKECMEAINALYRASNLEIVVSSWLRALAEIELRRVAGLSTTLAENQAKGASFVLRFASEHFRGANSFALLFEQPQQVGQWARYIDIKFLNTKYELKSVRKLTPTIVKQMARDIVANLDGDLEGLKRLHLVIDTDSIGVSKAEFVAQLQARIAEHRLFRTAARRFAKSVRGEIAGLTGEGTHPLMPEIQKRLADAVEGWPPRAGW